MIKILFLFFFLFPFFFQPQLHAFSIGDLNFYITNDFIFNYNKLSNKNNQFYESLSLFTHYKKWSLGLTCRINNFYKKLPNQTFKKPRFDVYRKFVLYNSKNFKINFGDFYSMLGRGLVFSILKNEGVFRERTILGGDIQFSRGKFSIRSMGGILKDETKNQKWMVAGGEAEYQFFKENRFGARFSYIDDIESKSMLGRRWTYSFGVSGNKILKNFSYYTEFAFLKFPETHMKSGYGVYSNLTYNKSHINCFLEFKRYKDFDNEMNTPPVADREDEIPVITDTTGVRFYFQYSISKPDITLFFNFGRYKEYDKVGNHYYSGFNIEDLWDRLNISISYGIRNVLYPQKRFDGHLIYQLSDILSFELSVKDKRYRDGNFVFKEQDQNFQISYSPYISIYAIHQYSFNKIMNLNHFFSGGIKIYFSGSTLIELSGGTIRGGQVCSGGQCFYLPPFKGIKFSVFKMFK